VGPFWTTGGTNWDQDRAQDQLVFDRSNKLADTATETQEAQSPVAIDLTVPGRPGRFAQPTTEQTPRLQPAFGPRAAAWAKVPGPGQLLSRYTSDRPYFSRRRHEQHRAARSNIPRAEPSRSPRRDGRTDFRAARPATSAAPRTESATPRRGPLESPPEPDPSPSSVPGAGEQERTKKELVLDGRWISQTERIDAQIGCVMPWPCSGGLAANPRTQAAFG
jgi:hypothetical protein